MTIQAGAVRWFDNGKGLGFIAPTEGVKNLFVHHADIQSSRGFRILAEGAHVEFEACGLVREVLGTLP